MSVVGINLGNSYASIAVFTKEGHAECIANQDGERQIACAVSFHGEQIYIGNQAKLQLVKNEENTIIGFRNVLGKKFSEIEQKTRVASAKIIQHPDLPDIPAYRVQILAPSPKPLVVPHSKANTPLHSSAPTPRAEPSPTTRVLTVIEVTSIFIRDLIQSAEAFLGTKVEGAVITIPQSFDEKAKEDLGKACKEAGVEVLQMLEEVGAVVGATTEVGWDQALSGGDESDASTLPKDRTQLVVDLGASGTSVSILSIREGLGYVLGSTYTTEASAALIDDKLVKFFAADFTKKTKIALPLPLSSSSSDAKPSIQDARAEHKLRLAIEHTKRTISASPGAATCSIESLKEGMDYTGSINRMRFDMLISTVYAEVAKAVTSLLATEGGEEGVDAHDIDEIVYIGGSSCLPGLDERLSLQVGLRSDEDHIPEGTKPRPPVQRNGVSTGTGGVSDPTTVLARGCAIQAALLFKLAQSASTSEAEKELKDAFTNGGEVNKVQATTRTIGVVLPCAGSSNVPHYVASLKGVFIPLIHRETALPARRSVSLEISLAEQEEKRKVVAEVWEVKESVRSEKVVSKSTGGASGDDDDDEPEETTIKHVEIAPLTLLGVVTLIPKLALPPIKTTGKLAKGAPKGGWTTQVEIKCVVGIEGSVEVEVAEVGGLAGKEGGEGARERVYVAGLGV
ncbi:Hsp70 protein-domain-containing protein [Crepidotus variabilis]|uniref:Hsp70 protein-domain-containing protein n=1 Tax=Crepidotus variabilis TaxID=179855 RepID=A0A9P6ECZ4_9AGAR|nr:Hsp70 protein-domain-containing protein [Crepidotus variabilis]